MIKSIMITTENSLGLNLSITGGVQLCSQEFMKVIIQCGFDVTPLYVNYTKNILQRALIKYRLDCYSVFDTDKDKNRILEYINEHNINYVFINHAAAIRYSKPIKEYFGERVKIFLLSHGNESGDFLHTTTKPIAKYNFLTKIRDIYRLGNVLHTESLYRMKYLDGVITVSQIEEQIEKWLGAKKVLYTPRTINKNYKLEFKTNYRKIGFIGRLDHPPNYHGISMLCKELAKQSDQINFEFALIGAPNKVGLEFAKKYPFIHYKGELSDNELEEEISTWALFLNPVFWYSMGVTTKIAKAIEWGVPVITTPSGIRGYTWKRGNMIEVNSPSEMAEKIIETINNTTLINQYFKEMENIKNSSWSIKELAYDVAGFFKIKD